MGASLANRRDPERKWMPSCPVKLDCALAQRISTKEALGVWQSFYCEGQYSRCERYKLASAGLEVPEKLLPNGRLQEPPERAGVVVPPHGPNAA
jgi:hypothetical protein